jgi:hypothetical protein
VAVAETKITETQKVARALRAEAQRLSEQRNAFSGWQAVEVSLRRIAEALERDEDEASE